MKLKLPIAFLFLALASIFFSATSAMAEAGLPSVSATKTDTEKQLGFLKLALANLQTFRHRLPGAEADDLVAKVELAIVQVDRTRASESNTRPTQGVAADQDADRALSFIFVLAPIFLGIIFVMAFAPSKAQRVNPAYQAALRNLRLAAIDFNISDEELLEFRRGLVATARYIA